MQKIQKIYKWIILFIGILIFIWILKNVFAKESLQIDNTVHEFIVVNLRQEQLTVVMKAITNFGEPYFLILITLLSVIFIKDKKIGMWITLNLAISAGLNVILKNIIQRPRPEGYRLIQESGYSFPSGHSMVSMAFYGLIAYLIWKKVKNKTERYILFSITIILPILIGISRIYLGVHYASDVLAGLVISISYLAVFTIIIKGDLEEEAKSERNVVEIEEKEKSNL